MIMRMVQDSIAARGKEDVLMQGSIPLHYSTQTRYKTHESGLSFYILCRSVRVPDDRYFLLHQDVMLHHVIL